MKRNEFLKHLKSQGCSLYREGAKHSVYVNTRSGKKVTVPRHKELHNDFCKAICRQLGIEPVK